MRQEFLEVMDLFFSEARGESSKGINPENLKKILEISKSQGAYYYVLLALKRLYDEGRLSLSQEDLKNIRATLFTASAKNTNKLVMFSGILNKFEEAGIKCCVLKGESLARFYSAPSFRISGDIDVLISPGDEQKAIDILRENGFEVKPRMWGTPHDVCYHSKIGRVELHIALYNDYTNEVWFKDAYDMVQEEYIKVVSENGYTYYTLGVTDGFIHTYLHGVEHFLTDGIGLRHISDILLYLKNYGEQIDLRRVDNLLNQLKYKNLLNTIIGIGILYCGFKSSEFTYADYDESLCRKLLEEIRDFGMFGKEQNGEGFNKRYTKLRYNALGNGDGNKYVISKRNKNILDYASLSKENMSKRYNGQSLLNARIIHIKKIFGMALGKLLSKREKNVYENREQLIKELDMI